MNRIYHTWDRWECYPAGFYDGQKTGKTDDECREEYRAFLSDIPRFGAALRRVVDEWPNSCEHYLTNESMNRIAWLGQASACIAMGLPSRYRPGYFLLTKDQQQKADLRALECLNEWLADHGEEAVELEGAGAKSLVNLY